MKKLNENILHVEKLSLIRQQIQASGVSSNADRPHKQIFKLYKMTTDEKEIIKELFLKLKAVYYRQKVNDDLIERILRKLPNDTVTAEVYARIENTDGKITEVELKTLEDKINNL